MNMPHMSTETTSELAAGMATAILIREFEQSLLRLFSEGRIAGTVHTCIGQEWTGIAAAQALREGDAIFSNHRCHGHFLAWTGNVDGLMAEVLGRESGVCGGRGGSQHLCDARRRFFSNGIQGGMLPVAAGCALAAKLKGDGSIVAAFIGDGTFGEGIVYETLNLAAKWELPLLLIVEDNRYAQSTPQWQTMAGTIAARGEAFGIPTHRANVWAPDELCAIAAQAATDVRNKMRPALLHVECDRLMAHSKGDDDRDADEVASYWRRDALQQWLDANPTEAERLECSARKGIQQAIERAYESPLARLKLPHRERTSHEAQWREVEHGDGERGGARVRDALQHAMHSDPGMILLGEDIESPYGGAFKITRGLSEEFPERVRNTPIGEALIVGVSSGLAMSGYVPVAEIMFGDFLMLAADQLVNHAAKFEQMYNGQVKAPMVIRTPMGGRRGYGPTHSQSLEKHLLGVPGTRMVALHERLDPSLVYKEIFRSLDCPTLVLENKQMYTRRCNPEPAAGFHVECAQGPLPVVRVRSTAVAQATVLCYGGMVPYAEEALVAAFDEFEIAAELLILTELYPLDVDAVCDSVRVSGRLLVVEEGLEFAALGAEAIAQVATRLGQALRKVRRLSAAPIALPASREAEAEALPGTEAIVAALRELVQRD